MEPIRPDLNFVRECLARERVPAAILSDCGVYSILTPAWDAKRARKLLGADAKRHHYRFRGDTS